MELIGNWERSTVANFTIKLLDARVGTIGTTLQSRLKGLTYQQLLELGLASANFQKKADLTAWLKAQAATPQTTRKRN